MRKGLLSFSVYFILAACVVSNIYGAPISEKEVQILTKEPDRPYVQLDIIEESARGKSGYEKCIKELQKRAFEMGADAIILLDGKAGEKTVGVVAGQVIVKRSRSSATAIVIKYKK